MAALNKWMNILETNIPKMLGITRSTTQLSKLMGLTLTDYVSLLDRGVFAAGYISANSNIIDYITISTTGNATDFGDLTFARRQTNATSNGGNDRGVIGNGYISAPTNIIDYITISSVGNATDFGDVSVTRYGGGALSNRASNRGVFGGGWAAAASNVIDYITINSTGNATDFGDLILARNINNATASNDTRGVFMGGFYTVSAPSRSNTIDYITISTTGNAQDFGDLAAISNPGAGVDNGTNDRALCALGNTAATEQTVVNRIDYITISTTGNASDFGDLSLTRQSVAGASNKENNRGTFGGGDTNASNTETNVIDYITINSVGNAQDFGDLSVARDTNTGTSNS